MGVVGLPVITRRRGWFGERRYGSRRVKTGARSLGSKKLRQRFALPPAGEVGLVRRGFGGEESKSGEAGFGERFYRQNELGNPCRRSFGGEERETGEVDSASDFIGKTSLGIRFGEVSAVKLGKISAQNVSCRRFKGKIQPTSRLHSKA